MDKDLAELKNNSVESVAMNKNYHVKNRFFCFYLKMEIPRFSQNDRK